MVFNIYSTDIYIHKEKESICINNVDSWLYLPIITIHFPSMGHSAITNHAVSMAESIAEAFYGCNGNAGELEALFPDARKNQTDEQTIFTINNAEEELGAFVKINASEELTTCEIRVGMLRQVTAYQEQGTEFDSVYELQLTLFPREELADETE